MSVMFMKAPFLLVFSNLRKGALMFQAMKPNSRYSTISMVIIVQYLDGGTRIVIIVS